MNPKVTPMPTDQTPPADAAPATSAGGPPAFLSDPASTPIYNGYVVVPETYTEGWCLGVITDHEDPDGVDSGDAFVVAPDGSAAGLIWEVGVEPMAQILPPVEERWGVYAVCFPHVVRNAADLASAFRAILPALKETYAQVRQQDR